jgi:ankyrin repeat protein
MQKMLTVSLGHVLVMAFLVTGVIGQNRKTTPRRTAKRTPTKQSSSAASIFDVLNFGLGDVEQVKAMLKKNPSLANARDETGQTPLHIAAQIGDTELVELLLENTKDVNVSDAEGVIPMHLAAGGGQAEVAQLLLAKKANANARDNLDRTPLHLASEGEEFDFEGRLEVAKLLLTNKADVNARNASGRTLCTSPPPPATLKWLSLLIDNKADVNARDAEGQTPLGAVKRYIEIIELLQKHGGK